MQGLFRAVGLGSLLVGTPGIVSDLLAYTLNRPSIGLGFWALGSPGAYTQRLQNPLIKEYPLNHNRNPTMI